MAEREIELERAGSRSINADLVPLCPGRTFEAIKGQRRQEGYRQIIENLRARQARPVERGDRDNPEYRGDEARAGVREGLRPRRPRGRQLEDEGAEALELEAPHQLEQIRPGARNGRNIPGDQVDEVQVNVGRRLRPRRQRGTRGLSIKSRWFLNMKR